MTWLKSLLQPTSCLVCYYGRIFLAIAIGAFAGALLGLMPMIVALGLAACAFFLKFCAWFYVRNSNKAE